jgi:hypothetical protein
VTLKIRTAVVLTLAAIALSLPLTAAASVGCRPPAGGQFPAITRLRASHAGCATARAVAEHIHAGWEATGKLPLVFAIYAGGPVFHCHYVRHHGTDNPYKTASAVPPVTDW